MTTPNGTPTPRTDAESVWIMSISQFSAFYVPVNFTRQLERELSRMTAERDSAMEKVSQYATEAFMARSERDALRSGTGWHSPEEWEKASNERNFYHTLVSAISKHLEIDILDDGTRIREAIDGMKQQLAEARKDSERRLKLLRSLKAPAQEYLRLLRAGNEISALNLTDVLADVKDAIDTVKGDQQ
jgi:multidrug resistance efflux pump